MKVKTWTTDAPYRETPEKVKLRKAEGCLTVEMETAAFLSIAQFRKVRFGQLLYGGDDVSGSNWDARQWQRKKRVREKLFRLAVDICINLKSYLSALFSLLTNCSEGALFCLPFQSRLINSFQGILVSRDSSSDGGQGSWSNILWMK